MLKPDEKRDYATKDGEFQPGGKDGKGATIVRAEWLNSIQAEVVNVIKSRGMELDPADNTQLRKAIIDIYEFGVKPHTYAVDNEVTTPRDLGHPAFDSKTIKAVYFNAVSIRSTKRHECNVATSQIAFFNGEIWKMATQLDPDLATGRLEKGAPLLIKGHFLTISADGVLQYQTSKVEGEDHKGSIVLSHFKYLRSLM
ncbi:unnamed protein product [Sphagnum tenellum]